MVNLNGNLNGVIEWITPFNVNGLNTSIKRWRLSNWILTKSRTCLQGKHFEYQVTVIVTVKE